MEQTTSNVCDSVTTNVASAEAFRVQRLHRNDTLEQLVNQIHQR